MTSASSRPSPSGTSRSWPATRPARARARAGPHRPRSARRRVRVDAASDLVLVRERLDRGGLGERVAEERLAHLVERARQLARAAQREADAQPAEAVDLREGPQQHEVGVAREQLDRGVGIVEQVELAVGLVDDHADVRRHLARRSPRSRASGSAVLVGLLGLQTITRRVATVISAASRQVVALLARRAPP